MKMQFKGNEIIAIVVSALVLGFVFGFDDGRETFNATAWLSNYFEMVVMAVIAIIIFVIAQKAIAARYGSSAEYSLWRMRRFGFVKSSYLHKGGGIPLGIIFPLVLAFLSSGRIFFAITGATKITSKKEHRLGRPFVDLTELETAKIAAAGPLISAGVALLLSASGVQTVGIRNMIVISSAIAIANMLPLPSIAGGTTFFASKFFYIFSVVWIVSAMLTMWYISALAAVILATIVAIATVMIVYYVTEKK